MKNTKKRSLYLFIATAVVLSCHEQSNNKINVHDSLISLDSKRIDTGRASKTIDIGKANRTIIIDKKEETSYDSSLSCNQLLISLIKTSSLDSASKELKFKVQVDEVLNEVARLELTIKNDERGEDVALSWIEMDINKKELRDVTIDPDNPVKLKYDTSLFRKVVENCKF